ncbi:MAG: pilus assembly protein N-terminal domain-containing protein [Hyphomicrobiaceae bacterium]|nr:pilus assembly protein N-terminal domain-containing protein [Hyphomicrobiaceae bacterium]
MTPYATLNSLGSRTMQTALAAAITLLAGLAMSSPPARASDLVVRYDQSQILRLPRPVSELIIGNPSIADIALQGSDLLVITGKTFGVTNVIALDAERNVIQDQRVIVQRDEQRLVNLHKGSMRQSYTCSPNCQPTITIGDDPKYFSEIANASSMKTRFSDSSAETTPGGGQ